MSYAVEANFVQNKTISFKGQKESVIDAVERMVDLCETDFKNSATWKSLHESENSSFSTESKEAAGQNNGWTSPEFGKTCDNYYLRR